LLFFVFYFLQTQDILLAKNKAGYTA